MLSWRKSIFVGCVLVSNFAFAEEKSSAKISVNTQTNTVVELSKVPTKVESISLESALSNASDTFAFIAKTFPKNFNTNFGAEIVEMEFSVSYDVLADIEYRERHKEFARKFDRIGKHEIVKKGNLPGAVDLTAEELSWWKQNFLNQRVKNKKFIDYLGESYPIIGIEGAKIFSSVSPWGAGEARNLEKIPEQAYRSVVFSIKLNKPVNKDERFTFFKKQPLWLVGRRCGQSN